MDRVKNGRGPSEGTDVKKGDRRFITKHATWKQ